MCGVVISARYKGINVTFDQGCLSVYFKTKLDTGTNVHKHKNLHAKKIPKDKTLVTCPKSNKFCLTLFCPIRYFII